MSRAPGAVGFLASLLALARSPAARLRRRRERRHGAGAVRVTRSRGTLGGVHRLALTMAARRQGAPEFVRALVGRLADVMASAGLVVGVAGVVPGEEPALVALAPRRDLLAPALLETLTTAGAARGRHRLWIGLAPGVYLATVVDPFRPFAGSAEEIAVAVRSGRAVYALSVQAAADRDGVAVTVEAYGVRSQVRRLLSLARKGRGPVSARVSAR